MNMTMMMMMIMIVIIIIIIHKTIFVVPSSTAQSHMREFTLGSLSGNRSAPGGRQLVGQAASLTYEFAMYYYSTMRFDTHLLSLGM